MKTKEEWIKELDLEPHVEGGYFRQTYKAIETVELPDNRIRALSTSILFLLTNQNPSHFHLLSSDEIWYYHFGHALTVHMIHPDGTYVAVEIGPGNGQKLQFTVPAGVIFGSTIESDFNGTLAVNFNSWHRQGESTLRIEIQQGNETYYGDFSYSANGEWLYVEFQDLPGKNYNSYKA